MYKISKIKNVFTNFFTLKTFAKISINLVFALFVRYLAIQYQIDIVDSVSWIYNGYLYSLIIVLVKSATEIIHILINISNLSDKPFIIEIICEYLEKNKQTLGGPELPNNIKYMNVNQEGSSSTVQPNEEGTPSRYREPSFNPDNSTELPVVNDQSNIGNVISSMQNTMIKDLKSYDIWVLRPLNREMDDSKIKDCISFITPPNNKVKLFNPHSENFNLFFENKKGKHLLIKTGMYYNLQTQGKSVILDALKDYSNEIEKYNDRYFVSELPVNIRIKGGCIAKYTNDEMFNNFSSLSKHKEEIRKYFKIKELEIMDEKHIYRVYKKEIVKRIAEEEFIKMNRDGQKLTDKLKEHGILIPDPSKGNVPNLEQKKQELGKIIYNKKGFIMAHSFGNKKRLVPFELNNSSDT